MIHEALELLRDEFRQGLEPQEIKAGDPHSTTIFLPAAKEIRTFTHAPPPRQHSFVTIEGFVEAVKKYGKDADPTVYVSLAAVVAVLKDDGEGQRDSRITLKLVPSVVFAELERLNTALSQDQMVRLLRTTLSLCEWNKPIRESIEVIKWIRNDEGNSDVSSGRNSLGREVQAAVSGLKSPIPETASCKFLPYPTIDGVAPVEVTCNLIVDHTKQTFLLQPQPHAVDKARNDAQQLMLDVLGEALECDVFIGTP